MNERTEQISSILVVDADDHGGAELGRALERLGYRVQQAIDGEQMTMLLKGEQYDVILVTACLLDEAPGDLLGRIRRDGGAAGLVVIADQPKIDSVLNAMRGRAVDYLIRPYGLDDLTGAIHRAVSECRANSHEFASRTDCCGRFGKVEGTDR